MWCYQQQYLFIRIYVANELSKLKSSVEDAEDWISVIKDGIAKNLLKIDNQENDLKSTENILLDQITDLKNDLASQTDRGMRSTLTFRGIYESNTNESYQKTPKVLAKVLSKMDATVNTWNKMSYSEVLDSIDRAHRSKSTINYETERNNNTEQQKDAPRPIHVKFVTWQGWIF